MKITIAWPGCFSLHLEGRPSRGAGESSSIAQDTTVMTAAVGERIAEERKL